MQEKLNVVEESARKEYEGTFLAEVFRSEFTQTCKVLTQDGGYEDKFVFLQYAQEKIEKASDQICYVGLRQRSCYKQYPFLQYVRIAAHYQCDLTGKSSVKILTLPFERVTPVVHYDQYDNTHTALFEAMQCKLMNDDVCSIVLFSTDNRGEKSTIRYKVNMKKRRIVRWKGGEKSMGKSAIRVWYNYTTIFPRLSSQLASQNFDRIDYQPIPEPYIWDEQIFSPQELRR